MTRRAPFSVVYAAEVKEHLQAIETKHHSHIQTEIEVQLLFQPEVETRNRKPLRRPMKLGAEWELRFGPDNRFRVFYQVHAARHEVQVLAVGVKKRNHLFIGGEEIDE